MMVNYSLEEFKAWLEEKPERKREVDWVSSFSYWETQPDNFQLLVQVVKSNAQNGPWTGINYSLHRQIVKGWITEVDQRERERANSMEGGEIMFKAFCLYCHRVKPAEQPLYPIYHQCFDCKRKGNQIVRQEQEVKYTTYLTQLKKEIQLIKEALHD